MAGQREYPGIEWDDEAYIRGVQRHIRRMNAAGEKDVLRAGIYATNRGKSYAAVDTGNMKNGIVWEEGRDAKGYFVAIYCRAAYWKWVEFGTRFMAAQPFMRPAFAEAAVYLRDRIVRRRSR